MKYEIIKDLLPPTHFNNIYNFLIECHNPIPWWEYSNEVAYDGDDSTFFFLRKIYPFDNFFSKEYFKIIVPILYHSSIYYPHRIRCNCYIKQPNPIKTAPHIDMPGVQHKVFLYSVNSNNGYTILDPGGENIKIPSVANQAIYFDGDIKHQAITQTDTNIRVNININF